MLTFQQAHELFNYRDGKLHWKRPGPKRVVGKEVGHQDSTGYVRVCVQYKMYLVHRIVWLMHHGDWPDKFLDHIDGNPSNNRIENLREVTHSENLRNNWKRRHNVLTETYKNRNDKWGLKARLD